MAKLHAKERNALPASDFALPGQRKYPMPDRSHAINAEGRAKQQLEKGKLSEGGYQQVMRKAKTRLRNI